MDAKTLARVGFRILAVYVMANGFLALSGLADVLAFANDSSMHSYGRWIIFFSALLFPFFAGLILWFLSPVLARYAVGKNVSDSSPVLPMTASSLQTVGFIVIGTLLVCDAIPRLVGLIYDLSIPKTSIEYVPLSLKFVLELSTTLVLGIVLILGAKFFTRVFYKLKEFGLSQASEEQN